MPLLSPVEWKNQKIAKVNSYGSFGLCVGFGTWVGTTPVEVEGTDTVGALKHKIEASPLGIPIALCCYGLTTFSLSILVHTASHALGELVGYMCRY